MARYRLTERAADDLQEIEEHERSLAAYTRDLNALQKKLKTAEEQSARGEVQPLDFDQLKREIRNRLAAVGIT